jgi:uncharacterized Zn finger protein (UPF0148 family)
MKQLICPSCGRDKFEIYENYAFCINCEEEIDYIIEDDSINIKEMRQVVDGRNMP